MVENELKRIPMAAAAVEEEVGPGVAPMAPVEAVTTTTTAAHPGEVVAEAVAQPEPEESLRT